MNRLLLILFFGISGQLMAQSPMKVSILTTTPGTLPHTMFGHTAIRVIDADNDFDKIYNFGLFDFESPNFGIKFLGGSLEYWLGRQTVEGFIDLNNLENREVQEQLLAISDKEAETILKELQYLHKPENKFYRYSFTSKNCSTEIRDLLNRRGLINTNHESDQTYRSVLMPYVQDYPWFKFSINLLMGTSVDRKIDYTESLFLPRELQQCIADTPGLVVENKALNVVDVYENDGIMRQVQSPLVLFSLLALLAIYKTKRWVRFTVYGIVGAVGLFLTLIWAITSHHELVNNFNVLWCNPLYLLYIPLIWKKKNLKYFSMVMGALCVVAAIIWLMGVQVFDVGAIPLLILLLVLNLKEAGLIKSRVTLAKS